MIDYLDLDIENDMAKLLHTLTLPDSVLASDAVPLAGLADVHALNDRWPLEEGDLSPRKSWKRQFLQ